MSIEIVYSGAPQRFDRWVKKTYPRVSFGVMQKWLRTGQIRVNKKRIKTDYSLSNDDIIRFPPQFENYQAGFSQSQKPTGNKKTKSLLQNAIIYEDDSCIVINKPQGLAVQGGTNLRDYIDLYLDNLLEGQQDTLRITHRLDKDTSGLLILAKTQEAAQYYTKAFAHHKIQKRYKAILAGIPSQKSGTIDLPIGKMMGAEKEKMSSLAAQTYEAKTHFTVQAMNRSVDICMVEFAPQTGRTHQLRVHAYEGLGCPILGDGKYGGSKAHPSVPDENLPLHHDDLTLQLCASHLSFHNPDGKPISLGIPLPDHFVAI